jgi:redox-sensitive bicupin YhaK (pirin superfamily)
MAKLERIITSRERDIGGLTVRRILPYVSKRAVGPFVFFDHMGPADFPPGHGMDVRPHPHINLATVTYLFEGVINHRDSLGSEQLIEPGAVNWMTAGRGIVHSERTPPAVRARGSRINGIQCWVALPVELEETEPGFSHHPADSLPEINHDGIRVRLLLGEAMGRRSPVPVHSSMFYLEVDMPAGKIFDFPCAGAEAAVYIVDGEIECNGEPVHSNFMAVAGKDADLRMRSLKQSRLMILGGESLGARYMDWNFISSRKDRIESAQAEWLRGPGATRNFPKIPGDDAEFIPLPQPAGSRRGTIM